ncbi:MAG: serine--tRNA ligase [Mycobacteriales bacterium]
MIDLRLLREDPERVRASQRLRGEDPAAVDALLEADEQRRAAVSRADTLRSEQKSLGKQIGRSSGAEREALLARGGELAAAVKDAEAQQAAADQALRAAHLSIPNVAEGAPPGGEDDYLVLREVGERPALERARDHVELGELLGAIDIERGAKVSGARFYVLTGVGALLEMALVNLAFEQATSAGLRPMIVPALVKPEVMEGTGFLGNHAGEVYRLAGDDLYLVGTAEAALGGYHMNEIVDLAEPRRYAGFSSCFRREAGSYGKDTRGIFRVHWFDKVEMFTYCRPEQAADEHLRLLAWEEELLGKLELPYRVIDVAAGDLGSSAARKYDCEAWIPSQERYREVTSTSNCGTFQARRLNVRYRDEGGKPQTAATLNGTLVAIARTIIAVLENHQQPDGSVRVPKALQPYLGGRDLLTPA